MKMKTRAKIVTSIIAIVLSCVLLFTVIVVNNNTNQVVGAATRTVELSASTIDAQSILNEFDDAKLTKKGTTTYFEGYKAIDKDKLSEIDYISETDLAEFEDCMVKYKVSYDEANDLVSLSAILANGEGDVLGDTIYGLAFINEKGEPDAIMELDGDYILLSEMQEMGLIQNCGWFKKLIAAAVAAIVVTAVVATVMVTGGAALGAVIGVCAAVGAVVGGTTSAVVGAIDGETSMDEIVANFGWGALIGGIAGAATGAAVYGINSLTSVKYGHQFGNLGKYVENPNISVDWPKATKHGLERMSQRGMSKSLIEKIVKSGYTLSQSGGKFLFLTSEGAVVLDSLGKLITTYGSGDFDAEILKVLKALMGG